MDSNPTAQSPREALDVPGGGEMRKLIGSLDWSGTPLGPRDTWPQSLRTLVDMLLAHPLPTILLWGSELIQIYNDGYARLAGRKHPAALGMPTRQCWPEVWEANAPIFERVLQHRESVLLEDQFFRIVRNGVLEDAWFTVTYSPVSDDRGHTRGVILTVLEATEKVIAERERLREERQRKRAELALQASRQLLETAVDHLPVSVCVIRGRDLRVQLCNRAYQAIAPGKAMTGKTLDELWPETGQDFTAICRRVLETGESYQVVDEANTIRRTPDGPLEPAYFSWSLHRVRLPGDDGWGLLNTAWETTARKGVEDALRESEARLRRLYESGLIGVLYYDLEGPITDANEKFLETVGYTREDLLAGRVRWDQMTPPEYLALDDHAIVELKARGVCTPFEKEYIRKDGSRVPIIIGGAAIDQERRKGIAFVLDITTRKRIEKDLERVSTLLETLLSRAPVGFAYFSRDLRYVLVNDQLAASNGLPVAEHLGKHVADIVPTLLPHVQDVVDQILATGQPVKDRVFSGETAAEPGAIRYWSESWYPVRDASGELLGFGAVVEEITKRKLAEDALQELNATLERQVAERTAVAERRTRDLRRLAAELSETEYRERKRLAKLLHDELQQLLVAARLHLPMPAGDSRDELEEKLNRMDGLLQECIQTSRDLSLELSPPILQMGKLPDVLEWLCEWCGRKYGLATTVDVRAEIPPVPEHVQVFIFEAVREMLFNVVKHPGKMDARVSLSTEHGELVVQVEDGGIGFDPQGLEAKLQQPQTFGLFQIRDRSEALGGRLEFEATQGGGARFRLALPLFEDSSPELYESPLGQLPTAASRSREPVRKGTIVRVLIVDDHAVVRQGFAGLLDRQPGLQVVGEAANGEEALRMAATVRPDVILMDVNMPGMDGFEATRRIKASQPEVAIIGLSLHDDETIARAMAEAGADGYFSKQAPAVDVVQGIRQFCRRTDAG